MLRGATEAQSRGSIVGAETRVQARSCDKSLVGENADTIAQWLSDQPIQIASSVQIGAIGDVQGWNSHRQAEAALYFS